MALNPLLRVPEVLTPTDEFTMAAVLRDAADFVFGGWSRDLLAVGWAHNALELAHGAKIRCRNYGNVTAAHDWTGAYYLLNVPPPDPPTLAFCAFDTHIAGARHYWTALRDVFAPRSNQLLPAFQRGDAEAASRALKATHYYTADEPPYTRAMVSLAASFHHVVWPKLYPEAA